MRDQTLLSTFGPFTMGLRSDYERQSDLPAQALWKADNIEFRGGVIRQRPGKAVLSPSLLNDAPYFLSEHFLLNGTIFLLAATPSKLSLIHISEPTRPY